MDAEYILDEMERMFPHAHCELYHKDAFQLVVAVALSAQTTDDAVNKVTPNLFEKFPTAKIMANADLKDIEQAIKKIGLYRNKAKNIKEAARIINEVFLNEVPSSYKGLQSLPGVGRKTANVVRSVWFDIPAFAVDTHVERISKRLGFAKFKDNVEEVETKLKRKIKRERWNRSHHTFIFFGRYHCTARKPKCEECPFLSFCKKDKYIKYLDTKKHANG